MREFMHTKSKCAVPVDIATRESIEFFERQLKQLDRLRILEVGCGNGEVAEALMMKNATVRAIDIDEKAVARTRERGVDTVLADILTYKDDPFDVILFSRCLHHIDPVAQAVASAKRLLKADGIVIVEDFKYDIVDEPTVNWLDNVERLLTTAGVMTSPDEHSHGHANAQEHQHQRGEPPRGQARQHEPKQSESGTALQRWYHHHEVAHQLLRSDDMLPAIQQEFANVEQQSCEYLYRYVVRYLQKNEVGMRLAKQVLDWERELLSRDAIKPVGWRVLARSS